MPSVYSSVFQNFIRQGFAKSLTHGYAQSVVAATHPTNALNPQSRPTFARRSTARVGRLSALGLQSAFHNSAHVAAAVPHEHRHERLPSTGALDAYFEHLQATQASEAEQEEWVQFQFQKRIEWKPTPASILFGSDAKGLVGETEKATGLPSIPPESEAALAHIDAALESAIEERKQLQALEEEVESLRAVSPKLAEQLEEEIRTRTRTPASIQTPISIARTVTPPVHPRAQGFADHLTKLAEEQNYDVIPGVFEAMLGDGVLPIAAAYNALLKAAIHLTSDKSEVVSKALDIYTDMRRRKVPLDSDTYDILVGLLASRSLTVLSLKRSLEGMRLRYGGMDEPGKFMFASHELEHAILSEDDRLDLAMKLFEQSIERRPARYSSETYHQLISACAETGRVSDMLRLFEHMEESRITPLAATFPAMITAFAMSKDLVSAIECYNEYRNLAIANDNGEAAVRDRVDTAVYASVVNAYIISGKPSGAERFLQKVTEEYGDRPAEMKDALVADGFVKGFIYSGQYGQALDWAQHLLSATKASSMSEIAIAAADHGDQNTAIAAFAEISVGKEMTSAAVALLAMSVRGGDVAGATRYWAVLSNPLVKTTASLIEPTAMYAVAMIGSGQVTEGLAAAEQMFQRIKEDAAAEGRTQPADEIEEAAEFISTYMTARNIVDPRLVQSSAPTPYPSTPAVPAFQDAFDPYALNTDYKASAMIVDGLERNRNLRDAMKMLTNVRKKGLVLKYSAYAKLISAAANARQLNMCHDVLTIARTDIPFIPGSPAVARGWSMILDAMVATCLNLGDRHAAEQFHQELLSIGSKPSANTYGLYITTLSGSVKTKDDATEAVKVYHRAMAEGVEPSGFLYNALIGKLGKARRIDDCLYYFSEMRAKGIQPNSVTYGTLVNALCRVSDDAFAEQLFDEMESMPNYKPRAAPYNSMMQFYLSVKRDKSKVLEYFERMKSKQIEPTSHTFKLLVDAHATLEPIDIKAADAVLDQIRAVGQHPEANHYASLIRARGCVLHDMDGARQLFDSVARDSTVAPEPCLYQSLFDAMVANHRITDSESLLGDMRKRRVAFTPYIANTLIHGWAAEKNINRAKDMYAALSVEKREPSTYEAMTRAFLAVGDRESAKAVVQEMLTRGFPNAVVNKVLELLSGGDASA